MYIEEQIKEIKEFQNKLLNKLVGFEKSLKQLLPQKQYSVTELVQILKLTRSGVLFHIRCGNLKATGTSKKKLVSETELQNYLQSKSKNKMRNES